MSKESFNYIKNTFLKLTSKTYPYGYEDELVTEMKTEGIFPQNLEQDKHGNWFIKLGESKTIFASHLDTACKDQVVVNHKIDGNIIRTDGKSILGADDKAGVTILLWMIKNEIPGLYYFFMGEEVGCIGSGLLSKDISKDFNRIISFDRRGNNSVITHQSTIRTCSDEFAKELSKQLNKSGLNYVTDSTGVPTKRDTSRQETSYDWEYDSRSNTKWNSRGFSRGNKKWSNKNFHSYRYDYDDYYESRFQKTRSKKAFYDSGNGNLQEIEPGNWLSSVNNFETKTGDNYKYDSVKDKFFNTSLSKEEIEIIKNQYLDMKNPDDRNCYEVMVNSLVY